MGEDKNNGETSSVISHAAEGVKHLMSLKLATYLLAFLLNVLVVRRVDRAVTGAIGVQLQLVLALALSLSRDVARRMYARLSSNESKYVVHVAWISVLIACFVSVPLASVWALYTPPSPAPDGYSHAVLVFALSALLEMFSEPFAALSQFRQQYNVRLRVEGTAATVRCILSYVFVVLIPSNIVTPLVCLALGQLSFGGFLLLGYSFYAIKNPSEEKDSSFDSNAKDSNAKDKSSNSNAEKKSDDNKKESFLTGDIWRLFAVYEWQAVQKVILQEGEKFVLVISGATAAVSADVSAIYSVVNNLASFVVRFVFAPVEEVCFTAFGKLVASGDMKSARNVLRTVLRFVTLIGLTFVAFGPGYSRTVIHVLYGSKYSDTDAPVVLAFFCGYILLLAINGTSEAFVHSVASEDQLKFINVLFVVFSAIFVGVTAVLVRIPYLGAIGLVIANGINMITRIIYSFIFIYKWQKDKKLNDDGSVSIISILPDKIVLSVLVGVFSCGLASAFYSPNMMIHVVIGCILFVSFIFAIWKKERKLFSDLRVMWSGKTN